MFFCFCFVIDGIVRCMSHRFIICDTIFALHADWRVQAAEEKKFASVNLAKELTEKSKAAEEKKASVQKDLSQVEPMLVEAKEAVAGVGPKEINELKALANPPAVVKTVLESVLVLLGKPSKDWKAIKSEVVEPTFLKRVCVCCSR